MAITLLLILVVDFIVGIGASFLALMAIEKIIRRKYGERGISIMNSYIRRLGNEMHKYDSNNDLRRLCMISRILQMTVFWMVYWPIELIKMYKEIEERSKY